MEYHHNSKYIITCIITIACPEDQNSGLFKLVQQFFNQTGRFD